MGLRLITEATGEPVSLVELKEWLRLSTTTSSEDGLLGNCLKTARLYGENYTKRSFMPETWELTLDGFPSGGIELPMPPLSTMSTNVKVRYIDSTGGTSTIADTAVSVDYDSEPGWVVPSSSNEWPDTSSVINAVKVQYISGYALDASSDVTTPQPIKDWICYRAANMYEHREPAIVSGEGFRYLKRDFVDGLLDEYRIISVST